ncbi:MAG TPA: DUF4349 domain-containing protein [Gemmatimonadaceae bacterium]|nr:DUF4349 domain-containing protein [Gemmatimonadaceae bacterium]
MAALVMGIVAACSDEKSSRGEGTVNMIALPDSASMGAAEDASGFSARRVAPPQAPARGGSVGPQGVDPGSVPVDAIAPMIIRTGNAVIEVKSIDEGVARLRVIATQLGGYVGNTTVQSGKDQPRSAMVEVKVPSSRWGSLLEGIKPIGTVESLSESAQDVGEEFVDVQARMENARRLEQRLLALLANRTGKLSDVLEVETQLGQVREEIERYQGRMRYLQTRAAVSTMLVNLHEPRPVIGGAPGDSPILDAFRQAWRNLIGLVAFLIASLGVLLPLAVLVVFLWWLAKRLGVGRAIRPGDRDTTRE